MSRANDIVEKLDEAFRLTRKQFFVLQSIDTFTTKTSGLKASEMDKDELKIAELMVKNKLVELKGNEYMITRLGKRTLDRNDPLK